MKNLAFLFGLFVLFSCEKEEVVAPQQAVKSVIRTLVSTSLSPLPDIKLDPKKKNGLHPFIENGKELGIAHYINNNLFGPFFHKEGVAYNDTITGESPRDGFYVKGLKHGQFNQYNPSGYCREIHFFDHDDTLWKSEYFLRWKSFPFRYLVTTFSDDIDVEIKRPSGEIWYTGHFVDHDPKGVHSLYSADGRIAADIDYNDWTISSYTRDGRRRNKRQITSSWSMYIG